MNSPALQTGQRQQHTVTPRLQHAVRLLQLSSLDFAQEVHDAMGRNPFLEIDETPQDAALEAPRLDAASPADHDAVDDAYEARERDHWQQPSTTPRNGGSESDISALDLVAADVGLRQHLHSQINVLPLSERDHALACAIIESLDDDGYLRTDLDELAASSGMEPAVEACE